MADYLSKVSGDRVVAAKRLLPAAEAELLGPVRVEYLAQMKRLGQEPDDEAAGDYLRSVLERDLLLAFGGYSDWLAALIWRKKTLETEPPAALELPNLGEQTIDALATRVDADPEMVKWLALHLGRATDVTLPAIGTVTRGVVTVDRDGLTKWASCFDWSVDEHPTGR